MKAVRLSKPIARDLAQLSAQRVVAAAVLTVAHEDTAQVMKLGLGTRDGATQASEPAPPARESGPYARRNLDGWVIKHKDLPKEPHNISHWAPNWHGSGSHLVSREVLAFPVEYHPAKLLTVSTSILEQLSGAAIVRVRVDQPLDRSAPGFEEDLLFNLRLLGEYCGLAKVFDADLSDSDFARLQHVDWEFLPPDSLDRVIEGLARLSTKNPKRIEVATERLQVLDRMKPNGFISGRGKFSAYFGARFGDRLVALENLEHGNALYLFEANWEQLSQLSRTELMKRRDASVHRVPHVPGWQSIIRKMLATFNV